MSVVIEGIAGLESLDRNFVIDPLAGSRFALPAKFPKNYASKWEEKGPGVIEAQQKQVIPYGRCAADGWQVYKVIDEEKTELLFAEAVKNLSEEEKKAKKKPTVLPVMIPFERVVGKKTYVLMFRPAQLQRAINAIYSDESRERTRAEVKTETVTVNPALDEGILGQHDLRKISRRFADDDEPQDYLAPSAGSRPTRINEAAESQIG